MDHIKIKKLSKQALAKLRKGKIATINPTQGEGIILAGFPHNIEKIRKSFVKGRGIRHHIEADEMEHNHKLEGTGIFGSWGDQALNSLGLRDIAYRVGDQFKGSIKTGLTGALMSAGTALSAVQPEFAPFILAGLPSAISTMNNFMDKPGAYGMGHQYAIPGQKTKMPNMPSTSDLYSQGSSHLLNSVNSYTGQNMSSLDRSGFSSAASNYMNSSPYGQQMQGYNPSSISNSYSSMASPYSQQMQSYNPYQQYGSISGYGFRRRKAKQNIEGRGLYAAGRGLKQKHAQRNLTSYVPRYEIGSIGTRPAEFLQSDALSSNFQFRNTLPIYSNQYIRGNGLY